MASAKLKKILRLARMLASAVDGAGCPLKRSGKRWERKLSHIASGMGLSVAEPDGKTLPYDRVSEGLRVQCKQRKTLPSGKVKLCFCARASRGIKKEAYLIGEFDVLALRCDGIVYIIPARVIESGDGITMKNELRPRDYAAFVDNWGEFRSCGAGRTATQLRFSF